MSFENERSGEVIFVQRKWSYSATSHCHDVMLISILKDSWEL